MTNLKEIGENTTTVIVAHRLSTIKDCDKIFFLEEGKIVESGSHVHLLNKNGLYASMYQNQLKEQQMDDERSFIDVTDTSGELKPKK